jgi:hypothetical protein
LVKWLWWGVSRNEQVIYTARLADIHSSKLSYTGQRGRTDIDTAAVAGTILSATSKEEACNSSIT